MRTAVARLVGQHSLRLYAVFGTAGERLGFQEVEDWSSTWLYCVIARCGVGLVAVDPESLLVAVALHLSHYVANVGGGLP